MLGLPTDPQTPRIFSFSPCPAFANSPKAPGPAGPACLLSPGSASFAQTLRFSLDFLGFRKPPAPGCDVRDAFCKPLHDTRHRNVSCGAPDYVWARRGKWYQTRGTSRFPRTNTGCRWSWQGCRAGTCWQRSSLLLDAAAFVQTFPQIHSPALIQPIW